MNLLSKLHSECFPTKPWTEKDFLELKKSGAQIVMSDNSFIVWRIAADEAEIITIGVHPSSRRVGTATALLSLVENELRKQNIKKIFLEVSIDNIAAAKLYEKNGFIKIGTRPKYYDGIDGIIMQKDLK